MDKLLGLLALIISGLAALFFSERTKRKDAEADKENFEYAKQQAVTQEKLNQLTREQQAAVAAAEADKGKKLSTEEMEEFLRKL